MTEIFSAANIKAATKAAKLVRVSGGLSAAGPGRKAPVNTSITKSVQSRGSQSGGKYTTENLAYPEAVEGDPMQGHYIIFEILKQNKAEFTAKKAKAMMNSVNSQREKINKEQNTKKPGIALEAFGGEGRPSGKSAAYTFGKNINKAMGGSGQKGKYNSLQLSKNATTPLKKCIALYMPPSVSVSYNAKYGEEEIGRIAETANAALQAFSNTDGNVGQKTAAAGGQLVGGAASGLLGGVVDKLSPAGTKEMLEINAGAVMTPRMELLFDGIGRRNFSYNFMFIPKNKKESEIVEDIVKSFKFHMASDYGGLSVLGVGLGGTDGVRSMTIPDFFNIKYMHIDGLNKHLNKISTCVLTNMNVEYGAERYTAYAEGRPQTTKLSLNFSELEIITKSYIKDGY
jgi:hypothetical protein